LYTVAPPNQALSELLLGGLFCVNVGFFSSRSYRARRRHAMTDPSYAFSKHLDGVSVDQALERVADALKAHGFGVLTKIDVKDTLKNKIDVDFRPYVILGACNPKLAYKALQGEPQIGLLLPCNVVVQEAEGGALVSFADPKAMFELVPDAPIEEVAAEARRLLLSARDDL